MADDTSLCYNGGMEEILDVRELLTLEQAAERAGLSVSGLRYLRSIGDGPRTLKIGRRIYIKPADLTGWLSSRAVPA